ncbi:MAG: hypothetical protein ACP5KA_07185 [Desulfurococcaceae archaeon]
MRVDAVAAVAVAVGGTLLLLALYARLNSAYAGALDCYAAAQRVAKNASLYASNPLAYTPPSGWRVTFYYSNGTVVARGSASRSRCYAYALANAGGVVVLVRADG